MLRGTLASGSLSEIFSHSLCIQSGSTAATVAQQVRDAWQTQWNAPTGLGQLFTAEIVYVEATAAQVLDPMVPDLGAAAHSAFAIALAGTNGGDMLPSQSAVAVSLTAGKRPNGTPFRGRFYLPPLSMDTVGPDGVLLAAIPQTICENILAFFNALAAVNAYASIWSRTVEDLVSYVDLVRVGNKVDTIRTRRNKMPETYYSLPVAGPQ
jgi:hypothetical protein